MITISNIYLCPFPNVFQNLVNSLKSTKYSPLYVCTSVNSLFLDLITAVHGKHRTLNKLKECTDVCVNIGRGIRVVLHTFPDQEEKGLK